MSRGTTHVAPPLPDEVGQGPSEPGRPLTAVHDPWNEDWTAPDRRELARKHSLARKRERLLTSRGHATTTDLEALEALPDLSEGRVGTGGVLSKIGLVIATLANAYWYYAITIAGIAIALPLVIGWSTSTVATGSMEPVISPGDVIAFADVDAADVPIGSIIRFEDPARPGQTITHRVVGINPDGTFETKGDANAQPDSAAVPPSAITGVARIVTPHAGLPQVWVGSEDWSIFTIWVTITVGAGMTVGLYGRTEPEPRRSRRGMLRPALAATLVAAFAGVGTAAWSSAAFAAQDGNDGSTFASATAFPNAPYVGSPGQAVCAVGASTTFTLTSPIDAGTTIIVRYSMRDHVSPATLGASDTQGNTYTVDAHAVHGTRAEAGVLSAYVTIGLSPGDQITVTHPEGDAVAIVFDVFGGLPATNRVSASATASGHSTTPVVSTVTADTDTLAIGAIALQRNSSTIAQPQGWTALDGGSVACDRIITHGAGRIETDAPGTVVYDPALGKRSKFATALVIYRTDG